MRLLVIVNVYRPDLGGGVLFSDLCEGLAARGHSVEVRCAVPYYPEWRDKQGLNGYRIHEGVDSGVRVRRHGLFIPRRPGSLVQRLIYEASFFVSLARDIPERKDYDLVMVFCPLVGAVGFGAMAARSAGCPLWLNVQDLSAQAASASGIVGAGRVAGLMLALQNALFNRADVWSTISPVMVDALKPHRRHAQAVHMIPNWLHASLAREIDAVARIARSSPHFPPRLLYSGNVGAKQDLIAFCRSLAASDVPFEFRIRAAGSEASAVADWVAQSGDTRFSMAPLGSEADLARQLRATDFYVITERARASGSFIPSKMLPALASGTPILAVCDAGSPIGREIDSAGSGIRFDWTDLDRIRRLLANPALLSDVWTTATEAARRRSDYFSRDRLIDTYESLLLEAAEITDHE